MVGGHPLVVRGNQRQLCCIPLATQRVARRQQTDNPDRRSLVLVCHLGVIFPLGVIDSELDKPCQAPLDAFVYRIADAVQFGARGDALDRRPSNRPRIEP